MEKDQLIQVPHSSKKPRGVKAIIQCITELTPIEDKDKFYDRRMIEHTEKCNASILSECDKELEKLLNIPLVPSNLSSIDKAVKRLSRTLIKSYKGYLDAIVLAQFYSQSPDKLYDQLSHLYTSSK